MQSRYSHVVNRFSPITHRLRGYERFFGDRYIASPCGNHKNEALAVIRGIAFDRNRARKRMKLRLRRASTHSAARHLFNRRENFGVRSRDQNVVRSFRAQHPARNFNNLLRSLAAPENYFRIALAQRAVMIDLRETEVLVRKLPQTLDGVFYSHLAALPRFKKIPDVAFVHSFCQDS